jgi:hypothetical protein
MMGICHQASGHLLSLCIPTCTGSFPHAPGALLPVLWTPAMKVPEVPNTLELGLAWHCVAPLYPCAWSLCLGTLLATQLMPDCKESSGHGPRPPSSLCHQLGRKPMLSVGCFGSFSTWPCSSPLATATPLSWILPGLPQCHCLLLTPLSPALVQDLCSLPGLSPPSQPTSTLWLGELQTLVCAQPLP